MAAIGSLYAWSVFIQPLEVELNESRALISGVFSIANLGFTAGLLIGPSLQWRFPASKIASLTFALAAGGLAVAGAWLSIWAIWIGYGLLFGLANGFGYGLSLQVAQLACPGRRGLASGIVVASYTAGSAAFAPMFSWGIEATGVGQTLLATAALIAIIGSIVIGLLRQCRIDQHVNRAATSKVIAAGGKIFRLLWLGFLFGSVAGVVVLGHAAAVIASSGGSAEQAGLIVSLVAVANCAGRAIGGWMSDKFDPARSISSVQMAAAGILITMVLLGGIAPIAIGLTATSFAYGWMAGAYPVVISGLFGIENMSPVYGRVNTAWGLAGICAPYIGGLLFDVGESYRIALLLAGVSLFCGGLVVNVISSDRAIRDG